jgi:flavin-binding protein dodecin
MQANAFSDRIEDKQPPETQPMPDHVYNIIELVGSSSVSADEAIRNAIAEVGKTHSHINWFQVVETRGHVADGKVAHFQVVLKVGIRPAP